MGQIYIFSCCSRDEQCLTQADIKCHGYDCQGGLWLCNGTIRQEGELCELTPGGHQEVFNTRTERNNQQFNCLTRSDEDFIKADWFTLIGPGPPRLCTDWLRS